MGLFLPLRPGTANPTTSFKSPSSLTPETKETNQSGKPNSFRAKASTPAKQSDSSRFCSAMTQKFGGGKLPTGTPSLAWSSVVVVVSLLAGASVVHNLYKPDLTLPPVDSVNVNKDIQPEKKE